MFTFPSITPSLAALRWLGSIALLLAVEQVQAQGVGIGTAQPHAAAALEVRSTTQGLLLPRLSQSQRDAIQPDASAAGLIIFNSDTKQLNFWDGTRWVQHSGGYEPIISFQGPANPYTRTYTLSTVDKTYTVPAGTQYIQVQATGASGNLPAGSMAAGGYGAQVTAILKVIPGERLIITIGGQGIGGSNGSGGANGGGSGGGGGRGGGSTDLRREPAVGSTGDIVAARNALVVAGGGGGGGFGGYYTPTSQPLPGGMGGNGGGQLLGGAVGSYGNADGSGTAGGPNGTGGGAGAGGAGGFGGGGGGSGTGYNGVVPGVGGGGGGTISRGLGGGGFNIPSSGGLGGDGGGGGNGGGGYQGGGGGTTGGSGTNVSQSSGGGGGGSSWVTPLASAQAPGAPAPVFSVSQTYGDGQLTITPVQ